MTKRISSDSIVGIVSFFDHGYSLELIYLMVYSS